MSHLRTPHRPLLVLAVTVLVATTAAAGASQSAGSQRGVHSRAAAKCAEVKLIAVRGSGDTPKPIGVIATKISGALAKRARAAGVEYSVYGLPYPAAGLPNVAQYPFSKNKGRDTLREEIRKQVRQCPAQKLVLVGYSQGAHVVGDVLSRGPSGGLTAVELSHVRAVALIADPRFNSREPFAAGSFRPGRNGALGARSPGDLDGVKGRIRSWCRKDDLWCQGPGGFREHRQEEYWADYGEEIVSFLAGRLGWGRRGREVSVVDFRGACNTATGCLRAAPDSWLPSRTPRGGLGVIFSGLEWRSWGAPRTYAVGRARSCAGGQCSTDPVALRVYQIGSDEHSRGLIYRCMVLTKGPVELVGNPILIDASLNLPFRVC